ncbi:Pan3 Pseudokinase domain [Nakaseomyces glabratus]
MDKIKPDWARDVPCRNVIIYGFCKKKSEGCPFKHDDDDIATPTSTPKVADTVPAPSGVIQQPSKISVSSLPSLNSQPSSTVPTSAPNATAHTGSKSQVPKFNAKASASFTPMSKAADGTQETQAPYLESPVAGSPGPILKAGTPVSFMQPNIYSTTPVPSPASMAMPNVVMPPNDMGSPDLGLQQQSHMVNLDGSIQQNYQERPNVLMRDSSMPLTMGTSGSRPMLDQQIHSISGLSNTSGSQPPGLLQSMNGASMDMGLPMNLRYPTIYPPTHSILQYHLYAPDPPPQLEIALKENERTPRMLFIPNDLREELVKRNLASLQLFPSGGNLPHIVKDYFGLVPLDFHQRSSVKDRYKKHKNSLYKVFSNVDGRIYLLRRIHDVNISDPTIISKTFQKWSKIDSSNVVALKDLFLTTAFGDSSLGIVYDYYPNATSLYEAHFVNYPTVEVTEDLLWSYAVQILNGLREIHNTNGVNIGDLDCDKIILTGKGRIKISAGAEYDIMNMCCPEDNEDDDNEEKLRKRNFVDLGEILFKLASKMCNCHGKDVANLAQVSEKLKNLIKSLAFEQLHDYVNVATIIEKYIGLDVVFKVMEAQQTYSEYAENVLSRELENGRLFRLICKLNFIFGRVENRLDINWSEPGDKFVIVLFYDYVFHQIDPNTGKPVTDLTHVLRCLNKLDAGVEENILLVTPDELNTAVVSYKKVKELVDKTFRAMTL